MPKNNKTNIGLIKTLTTAMITLSIIAVSLCGCQKAKTDNNTNKPQTNVSQELIDTVWEFAQSHPDGFTLDIRNMTEPAYGIAVSYSATQNSHDKGSLPNVISHALEHDGYVGGWFNPDNGLYYFDSTKLFPEDMTDDAIKFGYENGQHDLYILSTGNDMILHH